MTAATASLRSPATVPTAARRSQRRVLPGFGLSLGYTVAYLSLIVLIPLSAVFAKTSTMGWERFWAVVTAPRVVKEVKPAYTAEAMRAKVQGVVWLRCIVLPDGTVGRVEVARSLDSTFGLDHEAVKAARQWRFMPGTRLGEPVSVRVTIELTFTLR